MRILVLISALFLASCGVDPASSSSTDVSISFGKSNIATGAIGTVGSIPANIQSVSVVALNAAGNVIAGPIIANSPNFTLRIRVPNGNNIRFRILAFAASNATGTILYETLSAPVNLQGKPVAVPVKMNLSVKVTADKATTFRGGTVNLIGKVSGNAPDASSPLVWATTGGVFTTTDTYGATRAWQAPNALGEFTIAARIDPAVNPDQDPTINGAVKINVVNRSPVVSNANTSPLSVAAGSTAATLPLAEVTDPDGDTLQAALSPNKSSWASLITTGTNPLLIGLQINPINASPGTYTFTLGVTDGFGGNITQNISVTVTPTPTTTPAPIITKTFPLPIGDTTPFIYGSAPLGSVVDVYADGLFVGQTPTFDVSDGGLPQGGFSYTFTTPLSETTHIFTAYATLNGIRSAVSNSVSVTIIVPPAPSITTNNVLLLADNISVATITTSLLETTDPDTSATGLSYTITTLPTQGALSATSFFTQSTINSSLFQYTPNAGASGVDSFTFEVTDGTSIRNGTFLISYNFGAAKTTISIANGNNAITTGPTCNTVWDAYGSPYVVQDNVTINSGCSLTIQAGVIVKATGASYITNTGITVNTGGTLDIYGFSTQPVTFTTIHDDSIGGDTNTNGSATSPVSGQGLALDYKAGSLGNISFLNSNYSDSFVIRASIPMQDITRTNGYFGIGFNGTMNQVVSNLHIEHNGVGGASALTISGTGTNPIFTGVNSVDKYSGIHEGVVISTGANPTLQNFTIDMHGANQPALAIYDANTVADIQNNIIRNANEGISIAGGASATIKNNIIVNNINYGLNIAHATSALIQNNLIRGNNNNGIIVGKLNTAAGIIIRNNLIGENGTGIHVVSDITGTTNTFADIQSNTIGGNNTLGLLIDQYTNVNLLYNIFAGSGNADVASQSNALTSSYNLTTDGSLPTGGVSTDISVLDPNFASGFYLSDVGGLSPAVDAGPVGSDLITANLVNVYAQATLPDITPLDLGYHHANPAPVVSVASAVDVLPVYTGLVPINSPYHFTVTPLDNSGNPIGAGHEVIAEIGDGFTTPFPIFPVIDQGDGTYTFTYITTTSATPANVSVTVNGVVLTTQPAVFF